MSSFLLLGYYGFGNRGDDILTHLVVKSISEIKPSPEIFLLSGPFPQKEIYSYPGVKIIERKGNTLNKSVLSIFHKLSGVIYTGGSLFTGYNNLSLFSYSMPSLLARLLLKKRIFFGQGLGPFFNSFQHRILKQVFNNSELIHFRDKDSENIISSLKCRAKNIFVSCDPSFSLFKQSRFVPRVSSFGSKKIALNFRLLPGKRLNVENSIMKIINLLAGENGYNLYLFPMTETDEKLNRMIYDGVPELIKSRIRLVSKNIETDEMISRLSGMDISIGMRLHFNILSMISGTPAIALSYDPKVEALFEIIEKKDSCITYPSPDFLKLEEIIHQTIDSRKEISSDLLVKCSQLNAISSKDLSILKETVSKI